MSQIESDINIGPGCLIANWVEAAIAIVFVAIRMYTQIRIIGRVNADDYLIVGALLSQLVNTSLLTVAIQWGIGRHMIYLTPEHALNAMKFEFLSEPLGILGATLARVSFALFLLKFTGSSKTKKWVLWGSIWAQMFTNLLCFLLIVVQCQHIEALWDPNAGGKCWTPQVQIISGYVLGGVNSLHDLLLLFLPVVILKNLGVRLQTKIMLCLTLGTSIFAFVASIIKTVALGNLGKRNDFTYNTTAFVLWLTIETYIVICAASVPSLRRFVRSFKKEAEPSGNVRSPSRTATYQKGYVRQLTPNGWKDPLSTGEITVTITGAGSNEQSTTQDLDLEMQEICTSEEVSTFDEEVLQENQQHDRLGIKKTTVTTFTYENAT